MQATQQAISHPVNFTQALPNSDVIALVPYKPNTKAHEQPAPIPAKITQRMQRPESPMATAQLIHQTLAKCRLAMPDASIAKVLNVARYFPKHHQVPECGLRLSPRDHGIGRPLLIKRDLRVLLFDGPKDGEVGTGSAKAAKNAVDLPTGQRKVVIVAHRLKCAPLVWGGVLREAVFLQRLRGHEEIVQMDDFLLRTNSFQTNDETIHLVLEHCDQGNLTEFLKREPLSLRQKLVLIRDFLKGVKILHEKGILHRDLKPENLFIKTKDGQFRLKIGDLDLSCDVRDEAAFEEDVGTPQWLPPDRAKIATTGGLSIDKLVGLFKQSTTKAIDIFPIGTILHLLLTGNVTSWQKGPPRTDNRKEPDRSIMRRIGEVTDEQIIQELDEQNFDGELRGLMASTMRIDASERPDIQEICHRFDPIFDRLTTPEARPNPSPPPKLIESFDPATLETVRS